MKKFVASWPRELVWLGGVLGGLGVVLILWHVPQWQAQYVKEYPYQLAKLTDEYRRTLAQIIGGAALLYGLYLTQRRIVAAEDSVKVAQETLVTERFTQALEQLGQEGPDKMAIRLGGVYALRRLAKDSEKDHGSVMEVLTAHVRENAPRREEDIPTVAEKLPTDIQAILTVIGRRETTGKSRGTDRLDLNHTRLTRADLYDAELSGADLSRATLRGADLSRATLRRAYLRGADLYEADLNEADLSEADLSRATLSEAYLGDADLRRATLNEADLSGATLSDADLRRATLSGADLSGAYLRGADLNQADLSEADLNQADLSRAKNLTAGQVKLAINWRDATLPEDLQYLKDLPE